MKSQLNFPVSSYLSFHLIFLILNEKEISNDIVGEQKFKCDFIKTNFDPIVQYRAMQVWLMTVIFYG